MSLADFFDGNLATYVQPLAAQGYDDLSIVLDLGDDDFSSMCALVNMLPGHRATLKKKLEQRRTAAAAAAAAAAPPQMNAATFPTSTSSLEEIEKMTTAFERKLIQVDSAGTRKLGNLMDVYINPKNGEKLISFLGTIDGKKTYRCACNPMKIYAAGGHRDVSFSMYRIFDVSLYTARYICCITLDTNSIFTHTW